LQIPIGRWGARGAALFCVAFAVFQVVLALGAPFGDIAWGGSTAVLSPILRWASLGAAIYLLLAAALMGARAGDWGAQLPRGPVFAFNIFLAAQFALNTLANLTAKTGVERYGMGAASALGCLLCLAALIPRRRA
jgi:hypothetical protein